METGIQIFKFEDVDVRVEDKDGNPWFVAKDVCDILGIKNTSDATKNLDDDEKDGVDISDSMGRPQKTLIISESGLYHLIGRSNKPKAKDFSRWVRKEVLPSIRKTGSYSVAGVSNNELDMEVIVQLVRQTTVLSDTVYKLVDNILPRLSRLEEELPKKSLKVKKLKLNSLPELIKDAVKNYAEEHNNGDYRSTYNRLYKEFSRRHHINIKVRARNRNLSVIRYVGLHPELLKSMYSLAMEMYKHD